MIFSNHLGRNMDNAKKTNEPPHQGLDLKIQDIYLNASSDKCMSVAAETDKDGVLCALKNQIIKGWLPMRTECQEWLQDYWNYRNELRILDGLVLKGTRIIIPEQCREKLLSLCTNKSRHVFGSASIFIAADHIMWWCMYNACYDKGECGHAVALLWHRHAPSCSLAIGTRHPSYWQKMLKQESFFSKACRPFAQQYFSVGLVWSLPWGVLFCHHFWEVLFYHHFQGVLFCHHFQGVLFHYHFWGSSSTTTSGGGFSSTATSGGSSSTTTSGGPLQLPLPGGHLPPPLLWRGPLLPPLLGRSHVTYPIMLLYTAIGCPSASWAKFTWDPPV